ncbi:uncharacterized protein TRIADDRAFT_62353 [Trichoplax adhaerens]|uniref:C2H2-type domain-containing protein n=1 Tax=Trichoplax adhaerens TaxID=10228 RepID=B3SDJ4_TRIAD|nr:hypothetical protein TRIADDRAFT_62353 [Trichoplax adhaerens]EDV19202.1 hypothetical protein TRIADDRAFT_62353 [Trichoplax adhaerens]|eukprot:XP_002118322.1 hypothetical protein TRIADDRAFT_62353 [Trichoplax adhaerens]
MARCSISFFYLVLVILFYSSNYQWQSIEAQSNSNSAAAFPWWWWSLYVTFNNNPCRSNAARRSCDTCIKRNPTCYWCAYDNTCRTLPRGRSIPYPGDCANDSWHRTQCIISGNLLLIILPCAIAAVVIFVACILYCCCCRYYKKDKVQKHVREHQKEQDQHVQELMEEQVGREQLREDVRRKYGITKISINQNRSNFSRNNGNRWVPGRANLERSHHMKTKLANYSRLKNLDDKDQSMV